MANPLHPLQTTALIRDSYLRYLKTIYPFQDRDLRDEFWRALEQPEMVVKGPLLEASPPFKSGRSIAQLIEDGVLHPDFRQLCSDALPLHRPLYLHQEQAVVKVVRDGRNLVVATFGRGFYILDDYTSLRGLDEASLKEDARLFPVKKTWMYVQNAPMGLKRKAFQGQMMAVYIMGYGFFRFLIEYVRQPDLGIEFPIELVKLANPAIEFSPFNITTGQILNFIMILIGIGLYFLFKSRQDRKREQETAKAERPTGRKLRKKIR